ncbi:MAG TPA: hypothetical protein VD947_00435 [Patescibacteria group bacterium]|nr:hypothetical protein [Patescibacteria group bacterium]
MNIPMSPEAQKALAELPPAEEGLRNAERELKGVESELKKLDEQQICLGQDHENELEELSERRAEAVVGSYDPELRSVIGLALGNEDRSLPDKPDLGAYEKIAELDAALRDYEGQPIVVISPQKSWIDIGVLQEADPEARVKTKGLVIGNGPTIRSKSRIEIAVYGTVAIDPETGMYPEASSDASTIELFEREQRFGGVQRPIIDPLNTRAILPTESSEDLDVEDRETTLVFIGFNHLQSVMNDIFSFDPNSSDEAQSEEAARSFRVLDSTIKKLRENGLDFDPDFINGYLSYRIGLLEQDISLEEAEGYKTSQLKALQDKHEALLKDGWISQ